MRRRLLLLVPLLALVACDNTRPLFAHAPRPGQVVLTQDLLTVRLRNGETCLGPRTTEGTGGWSGRLQGCSANYDYAISVDPGENPVRMVFTRLRNAVGLGRTVVPLADVTISDGGGRNWNYRLPERRMR